MADKVKYLLSLRAVRERAQIVGEAAAAGKLSHFDVHEDKLGDAADFVTSVIKVSFFRLERLFLWMLFQNRWLTSYLLCLSIARLRPRPVPYYPPTWPLAAL